MTHLEIVAAIEANGGRLVASFVLDEYGRTEGAPCESQAKRRCGACGEHGHDVKRCNGPGNPPKLTHHERRRAKNWLDAAAATPDSLTETRRILAERSVARRATRLKR